MAAEIDKVRMSFSLGATLQVDGVNWVKPASEFEVGWRGGMPSDKQVADAFAWMMRRVENEGQPLFDEIRDAVRAVHEAEGVPAIYAPRPEPGEPQPMQQLERGGQYRKPQKNGGSGDGEASGEGNGGAEVVERVPGPQEVGDGDGGPGAPATG